MYYIENTQNNIMSQNEISINQIEKNRPTTISSLFLKECNSEIKESIREENE
jgi:hypothetical protein